MNGILYIPYVNTDLDEDKFEYRGNAFDYINQLDNVRNTIVGADYYFEHQPKTGTIGFNANINKLDNNYSDQILFYELPCNFMDSNETPLTITKLLEYFGTEESFMMVFSFDQDNTNEDVLIELKGWVSESRKVMEMPDENYSEEIKIGLLPRRQFKLKTGKANAYLNECLFFDNYDNKVVIFVKKIIFYN